MMSFELFITYCCTFLSSQQVVMVSAGQQQPHTVILHQLPSYVGHIVFACIVFWLCNLLFGLIAFILAG